MAMMVCSLPECYRPRHQRRGIIHDFCSRTHAQEAADMGLIPPLHRPHGRCHVCQLHGCNTEVFFDEATNTVHDFCCRRHANMARARGQWPRPGMQGSSVCQYPGCNEWVSRNPETGEESAFCSRSHLEAAQDQGAQPAAEEPLTVCQNVRCQRPAWMDHRSGDQLAFCGSRCAYTCGAQHLVGQMKCSLPGCNDFTMLHDRTMDDMGYCCDYHRIKAEERNLTQNPEAHVDRTFRGGPSDDFKLSVLTKSHQAYSSLKEQFLVKFQKPVDGLSVERIFKVQVPGDVRQKHKVFEEATNNTRRRFHGTSCSDACRFFMDLRGGPCGRPDCNVCSICTHGFRLRGSVGRTAQRTNMNLRYGEGLYFSSVSGKANDYAAQSEKVYLPFQVEWRGVARRRRSGYHAVGRTSLLL
ncbi:conserved unknown protein [Ectocarpus siliculosus]|uniref:PARP catalytic domain-containing protein n=1 Tax=Ectocarpus siliculosus TaxID=2880 RepID=D8LSB5_ECTSI|nr:conserved unknown protein [Ectocarpus siliculosus]|eukprot:CBN75172.1 conserved unknown protein [Ectocarpus siliculosus]